MQIPELSELDDGEFYLLSWEGSDLRTYQPCIKYSLSRRVGGEVYEIFSDEEGARARWLKEEEVLRVFDIADPNWVDSCIVHRLPPEIQERLQRIAMLRPPTLDMDMLREWAGVEEREVELS